MIRTNGYSKALFGGLLWGDRPVRFMFMDEAGTSANEPVTVVVGIIANADQHVMVAEKLAIEAIGGVPERFRDDFVFHAMQVFGDKKYQNGDWGLTDRLELLYAMMSIPRRIGMAVCVSAHWRGATDWSTGYGRSGMTPSQGDHFHAFIHCVGVADRNIRKYAGPTEVATIVAEDHGEMRKFLKFAPRILRDNPITFPQSWLRQTDKDKEVGYSTQRGELRVERIRNSVHFVEKANDPLVQVADACAYGFRRYFAKEKFGTEFAEAILGSEDLCKHFSWPGGTECFWPIPSD